MIEEARAAVAMGKRSLLFYLPTGAGKTQTAIAMMRSAWEKGYRAIFFAHRRQLVEQTAERFRRYGIDTGIIMAGYDFDPSARLVIASLQTWERRQEWLDREYGLVFFDEAHIGVRRQERIARDIREFSPFAVVVGLTATPMTNQGPGLGIVYDELIHGPSVLELMGQGYLSKAEYYMMQPIDWDPRLVFPVKGEEYDEKSVFEWFRDEAILGDVIQNWQDNFNGRPTIVFARSVEQSIYIAEGFGKHGIPAAHIDYRTPDKVRHRILNDFRAGNIAILTNVDIFSEGFDMPDIEVAILATPINSLPRYIQRVGRVFRPAPGKERAIIVDHGGVLQQHGRVEDYLEWALEPPRPDRSRPAHAVKKLNTTRERRCPICGTTFEAGLKACPKCGYDFYKLPPGYQPPIIPATMMAFEEWQKNPNQRKRCKPISSAPHPYDAYKQLYHMCLLKGYKRGFAKVLFYSIYCQCIDEFGIKYPPRHDDLVEEYGDEPTDFAKYVMRRYWTLQKYGHFKDVDKCFNR